MKTKRAQAILVVAVFLSFVASCANKNPNLQTPEGQRAVTALQVVQRIGEFQNFTIRASDQKLIPEPTARIIVQWCVVSLESLKNAPEGWNKVLLASWGPVKAEAEKHTAFEAWVILIDGILTGVLS